MCAARNYTCGKAFQEIFPEEVLKNYLGLQKYTGGDDRLATQMSMHTRALLAKLLLHIYVDKEPRLYIQKPSLGCFIYI
jgi:hypothetical protein